MKKNIRYIRNSEIDKKRWDDLINNSYCEFPYLLSKWLGVLTDHSWDALVLDDYEAIMPLPFNSKLFGIKQVYKPIFTQRLGIVGNTIDESIVAAFIESIPAKFRFIPYCSSEKLRTTSKRKLNLILSLGGSAAEIQGAYRKSMKQSLKKIDTRCVLNENIDIEVLIQFYKEKLNSTLGYSDDEYDKLTLLLEELKLTGIANCVSCTVDNHIVSAAVFIHFKNRIIYLLGASSDQGRTAKAMHFILHSIIQKNAGSNKIFDFEGSEIPGVQSFFRAFGAQEEYYYETIINRLPFPLKQIQNKRLSLD